MTDQEQQAVVATPTLPKGGGAIQSIGKGWGAVGATGAASFEIGLPITGGRGYAPPLTLSYQSTVGNGLFGLGWDLSLRCVARRATKGAPLYTDDDVILGPSGDVWMPARDASGDIEFTQVSEYNGLVLDATYQVIRYFARNEGAFERIEHWRLHTEDPGFWLVHGADGSLAMYGRNPGSCSTDPDNPGHVAEWLLEETMNAHGEHIIYQYKAEDLLGLPAGYPRDYRAQCYLNKVLYGNVEASEHLYLWHPEVIDTFEWHFHLLFDYGERTDSLIEIPGYEEAYVWPVRSDAHSSFAYGFELGNLRLCRQVLMFHQFAELGPEPVLINRLLLEYQPRGQSWTLGYNLLTAAHLQAGDGMRGEVQSRPPMEFVYQEFAVHNGAFTEFDAMPGLDDGQQYQLVDLYGEGMPGVLYCSDKGWVYREPMRAEPAEFPHSVSYGPWTLLPRIPVADARRPMRQALTDLTGDGRLDWLLAQPGFAGYFTLNPDRSWSDFVAFKAFPPEFFHKDSQLTDLVGAGLPDLALMGPRSVRLYPNKRADGYDRPMVINHADDRLPLVSNSPNELVAFSDILGTGQSHLIRIRHDGVEFWPNRGRGQFGHGQRFADLPFSYAAFNSQYVRLADLDGSGSVDLLYLESDGMRIFMNQGGNGFAEGFFQPWPPGVRFDNTCQVSVADLNGLGCSSVVLTLPHRQPGLKPQHWRFDYPAIKPYLMSITNNNMGAAGNIYYRSSAQEWLDEKQALLAAGKSAESGVPFALHVVTVQVQRDEVTGNQLTQSFEYRQGYYDRFDREFRGFGRVSQLDTEMPAEQDRDDAFTAPLLTRTWFHTGRYPEHVHADYNDSDTAQATLGQHLLSTLSEGDTLDTLIDDASDETLREMARALSGSALRVEVFGLAASGAVASVPYSVQASRYLVRQLQARGQHAPYARMLVLGLESISYGYEQQADDPLCQHDVNLSWDQYGVLTQGASVNLARRQKPTDTPPFDDEYQQRWWLAAHDDAQQQTYLQEARAQAIHLDAPQGWRLGLPYQSRANAMLIASSELPADQVNYEGFIEKDGVFDRLPRTLVSLSVQGYKDCGAGEATFVALPAEVETAELDDHALTAYERVMDRADLPAKLTAVGYRQMLSVLPEDDLNLWSVRRGFAEYAGASGFYRVTRSRPTRSHGWTAVEYDAYHLLVSKIIAPDGCTTVAEHEYRTLQPRRITDPNQNVQEAIYDQFGMLRNTSFYGTERGIPVGFDPLTDSAFVYVSPARALSRDDPWEFLDRVATAFFYDSFSWMPQVLPGSAGFEEAVACGDVLPGGRLRASARDRLKAPQVLDGPQQPVHSLIQQADRYPDDPERQIRMSMVSVDGFGRALQTRQLVEDGDAYSIVDRQIVVGSDGKPIIAHASPRWRVSERVEYNNKGLAVRVYRPYFANTHEYINDVSFREHGYCDRQYYDPLGRPTVTWTAKGWMRRETYWTWYTVSEDENDTAEEVEAMRVAST